MLGTGSTSFEHSEALHVKKINKCSFTFAELVPECVVFYQSFSQNKREIIVHLI